jgi:hypothetical protein
LEQPLSGAQNYARKLLEKPPVNEKSIKNVLLSFDQAEGDYSQNLVASCRQMVNYETAPVVIFNKSVRPREFRMANSELCDLSVRA